MLARVLAQNRGTARSMLDLWKPIAVVGVPMLLILLQPDLGTAIVFVGIFLAMLLASPVVYPWYVLWLLCFVPLMRSNAGLAGVVFSGTVIVSYLLWHSNAWTLSTTWQLVEYVSCDR